MPHLRNLLLGHLSAAAAMIAAPSVPVISSVVAVVGNTGLTATWTAPSSGGTATGYNLRYSVHAANSWTTASGVTSPYSITGLTAGTSYDVQVQATNASPSSPGSWSASTTTSTYNYAMGSGFQPYGSGTSYAHASTCNANASDNSASADGSHTVPANVYFGWSTSPTIAPTSISGMTIAQGQFTNSSHNYWYAYGVPTPASAGTYYFWAVETNAGGVIVASAVQGTQPISGGTTVAFTIT